MPASPRSLAVTDAYRRRLFAIRDRTEGFAKREWPSIENLDGTDWPERMAAVLTQAQAEAVRASGGYLSAYLSTETGQRQRGPTLDTSKYAGLSRDGRALRDSLISPLIGTRTELARGMPADKAIRVGRSRAIRMVEMDLMNAARTSLREGMDADERVLGWQRAVRGTCGACSGDIEVEVSVEQPEIPLEVHPNCQCVTQPVVGVRRIPMVMDQASQETLRDSLGALSRHEWPLKHESIPIRFVDGPDEFINKGILPKEIRLRRGESLAESNTSLAHEAGHYLDMLLVDRGDIDRLGQKFLSSRPTAEMKDLLAEARASETMRRIKRDFPRDANELNRSVEIWARAYAQWQGFAETKPEWAWGSEEFKPIGQAVEKVLRAEGLL